MFHPFKLIPPKNRADLFLLFFSLTVIIMLTLSIMGESLKTAVAPQGILTYEFAKTVQKAQAILDSWDHSQKVVAGFHLGLDFLFLFAYSSTIALAIIGLTEQHVKVRGAVIFVTLLAWCQWIAALLDATENVALASMLMNEVRTPWPQIAAGSALIKFILVFLGIGFVVVFGLVRLYRSLSSK